MTAKPVQELLGLVSQPKAQDVQDIGIKIGQLYTDSGYPVDLALSRFHCTKECKLLILHGTCQWLIEHRRQSGATDKAIERQRSVNRRMIEDFISNGETGVY